MCIRDRAQLEATADDIVESERLAELAIPEVRERSLELPSIILPSVNEGIGHEFFTDDDGTLLNIVAHASPMKSKEERDALKQVAKARRATAKTNWQNNSGNGQLQDRIEALEAIVHELMGTQ